MKSSDLLSFKFQFIFEEGDAGKALRLHKILAKHGVVSNIRRLRGNDFARRENRLQSILNCMVSGVEYTTGSLWRKYGKYTNAGPKTFQRDLNTLILQGLVQAKKGSHPCGTGRTTLLSKRNIYVDKYPEAVK